MRKQKDNTKLLGLSVEFSCNGNTHVHHIDLNGDFIYSHEDECEMCGSHGRVYVDVVCPHCKKGSHEITLNEW
jgi:hypothetical protein